MLDIKRRDNEDIVEFITRALDERNKENQEVSLDFGDGIVINSEDFADSNDILSDIRYEYVIKYNEAEQAKNEIDLDEDELEENLPDEMDNNPETPVEDMKIEENGDETSDNESNDNNESNDEEDIEDEFEENLPDLEENNDSSNEELQDEEDFDMIMPGTENLNEISETNENKEEDSNQISRVSMESLDLLTKYALASGEYLKIDREQRNKLNEQLKAAKDEYNKVYTFKFEKLNNDLEKVKEYNRWQGNLSQFVNNDIDRQINFINSEKEEYNRIVAEYEEEKKKLAEGTIEFENKIKENPGVQRTIELLGERGIDKEHMDLNRVNLAIAQYGPEYKEELEKYAKLKWNVEAYEEYIDGIYGKDYLKLSDEKIKQYEAQKTTPQMLAKSELEHLLEAVPGIRIKNGKIDYDIVKEDPDVIEAQNKIDMIQEQMNNVNNHPVSIQCEIIELMKNGADKETINGKLSLLTSMIPGTNINDSLNSDKKEALTVEDELLDKKQNLATLQNNYNAEDYVNYDLVDLDNKELERLKEKQQKELEEIRKCDDIINKKEDHQKIKELDKNIAKYKKLRIDAVNDLNKYITLHGDNKGDKQLARLKEAVKFNKETLLEFQKSKKNLSDDIKLSEKLTPLTYVEVKKQLSIEIEKDLANEIKKKEQEIKDKKDKHKYDDLNKKNKMLNDIDNLKDDIEMLESLKTALTNNSVEQLSDNVLNYQELKEKTNDTINVDENINNNIDNNNKDEEIENEVELDEDIEENLPEETIEEEQEELEEVSKFTAAKKALVEKIKSIPFKKAAVTAIAVITTAAISITAAIAHHNTKKELENLREEVKEAQTNMNQFNDTINEKMNEIIDKQENETKSKILTETNEVQENMVDTSKIAKTAQDAANGNFIDEDKVQTKYFSDDFVQSLDNYNVNEDINVKAIVGHDGSVIGYTQGEQTEQETSKTR